MRGQVLIWAWERPAMPCTAPGPDTVSSTPGTPVRNPEAAAAYPAACIRNCAGPDKRLFWEGFRCAHDGSIGQILGDCM